MPQRPCPTCSALTPRFLPVSSDHAISSYYRCDACGSVWTYPKGQELSAPPRMVTVRADAIPADK